MPGTTVKSAGLLLPGPGLISDSTLVPAGVPSENHSSVPPLVDWLSVATKITRVALTAMMDPGTTDL